MQSSWSITLRIIILSVALGAASGVLATALTTDYLTSYAIQLGDLTAPLRIAEERPRAFPQSQQEAIDLAREKVVPGIVEFYTKLPSNQPRAYLSEQAISRGVVITSDGWLVTKALVGQNFSALEVIHDDTVYEVVDVVTDPVANVVFIKINANNLPVLSYGNGLDTIYGEQVFVVPSRQALTISRVSTISFGNKLIRSSDIPARRIILEDSLTGSIGAPVTDLAGNLLGIIEQADNKGTTVLPLQAFLGPFNTLLREQILSHPSLGVESIDLSHAIGLSVELTHDLRAGALLYGSNAVLKTGAADEAGLKTDDIVISIDGEFINSNRSLDEYIAERKAGQDIVLRISRDGEEQDVEVKLGALE